MSRRETALRYFNEMSEESRLRMKTGIEQYRKGDAVITVVRADSTPVEGDVNVHAVLKNHEFRFGCNIFMLDEFETEEKNRIYREKFPEIFNLATVPFYWSDLEPEEGKPRFAADSPKVYRRPATDLCVDYCLENGIEPKCHCLNYDNFAPEWVKNEPVSVHKRKLEKRMREIAERYADKIPSFEVTNETLQGANSRLSKFYYEDDFLEWSYRMADRYYPNNRLIINDYAIWEPGSYNDRCLYYMQIERLLRNGITHLDSIGMQFHSFFSREAEAGMAAQRYNPDNLYRLMDNYAKLGLPEQITEMTISAYSGSEEDEEIQADLIEGVYRTFFSHPAMEAIIYWNYVDGYAFRAPQGDMTQGENVFYGALLRFDMSEKPAYQRLRHLIREEWHTDVTVPVKEGNAKFRGFYGDYEITVIADGREYPAKWTLSKEGKNKVTITI